MDNTGRLSVVFYRDWYNMMQGCDADIKLKLYDAIMRYAFEGVEPHEPAIDLVFSLIRQRIDADADKWIDTREKRREAANKRWEKQKHANDAKACNAETNVQKHANDANNAVNVNVNVNGNVTSKEKKLTQKKDAAATAAAARANMEKRKQAFYNTLLPYVDMYPKQMLRDFFEYWTEENKSGTQFRRELERTWALERRLRTWAERETRYGNDRNNTSQAGRAAEAAQLVADLLNGSAGA